MSVPLDTNACIAAISGRSPLVRHRIRQTRADDGDIFVSTISFFEMWFGIADSARADENRLQLAHFQQTVTALPFETEDARFAGAIRFQLKQKGTPIGPYDCLIAAQAVRHDLTLITANVREFSRVDGLRWEDWSE